MTLKEFYIKRNVKLLTDFHDFRKKGMTVRVAQVATVEKYFNDTGDKLSKSVIRNLLYYKKYPYALESLEAYANSLN